MASEKFFTNSDMEGKCRLLVANEDLMTSASDALVLRDLPNSIAATICGSMDASNTRLVYSYRLSATILAPSSSDSWCFFTFYPKAPHTPRLGSPRV